MTIELPNVYSPQLLALAASIPHARRLEDAHGSATAHSKLCGSTVSVDVKLDGEFVADFGQDVKACLLGQAAASIVGRHVIGTQVDELRALGRTMRAMLKEGGPAPIGKWRNLELLEPVRDYRARHASTLLVFDALEQAIAAAEAKSGAMLNA